MRAPPQAFSAQAPIHSACEPGGFLCIYDRKWPRGSLNQKAFWDQEALHIYKYEMFFLCIKNDFDQIVKARIWP